MLDSAQNPQLLARCLYVRQVENNNRADKEPHAQESCEWPEGKPYRIRS